MERRGEKSPSEMTAERNCSTRRTVCKIELAFNAWKDARYDMAV